VPVLDCVLENRGVRGHQEVWSVVIRRAWCARQSPYSSSIARGHRRDRLDDARDYGGQSDTETDVVVREPEGEVVADRGAAVGCRRWGRWARRCGGRIYRRAFIGNGTQQGNSELSIYSNDKGASVAVLSRVSITDDVLSLIFVMRSSSCFLRSFATRATAVSSISFA